MKLCRKCGKKKGAAEFHKNSSRPDGLFIYCRKCQSKYARSRYRKNPEKWRRCARLSYQKFLERYRAIARIAEKKKWKENPKKMRKKALKYALENPQVGKRAALKKRYGMTLEDWERLFKKQKGRCAICKKGQKTTQITHLPGKGKGLANKSLFVDHDHKTGKVRGLLCSKCNTALGLLLDSSEIVQNAFWYLCRHARAGKPPEFDRTD